jgi:hypothetical protein
VTACRTHPVPRFLPRPRHGAALALAIATVLGASGAALAAGPAGTASASARGATTASAATTTATPSAPARLPVPESAYDVATPETYRAMAARMGTEAGIDYRYGPDAAAYGTPRATNTYPGPRPSKSMLTLSGQRAEKQRDGIVGGRGCARDGWCGEYQIGDRLLGLPGDYSSSIVNVAYLPDAKPAPNFPETRYWGVASLQTINVGHNVVSWKPEPSWTTYISPQMNNADNDENTVRLAGARGGSPIGTGDLDGRPVAAARGYGRGGWVNNVLTVFANGWITSSGSNTSHNFVKLKLPEGKTPTAIAITNSGEFALVTVWDTAALKGQIAVVALADGCQGCETLPEAQWNANWGSHRQAYAGLPGLGNYLGAKLVGFVDLPDTLKAPTEISATTGKTNGDYQRIQNFFEDHLQSDHNRRRYYDGDWSQAIARSGLAVVVSKSEKRAAVIDLRPLFQYYRKQYFDQGAWEWGTMISGRGPGPRQWPFTFEVAPAQTPVVVKVIDLPDRPTAVKLTREPPYRAFIATQEGKLRVFDLGTRYLDQKGEARGRPEDIAPMFSVDVGRNPTSIAYVKEKATLNPTATSALFGRRRPEDFLWVLSRGERKATMLQFDPRLESAKVYKTLQDSRLVDPIAIEDVDNHGTESYILTVADYQGRTVHNYPYGPIVMWTHDAKTAPCPHPKGCALRDGLPFEYAGGHALPGKPFQMGGANIN